MVVVNTVNFVRPANLYSSVEQTRATEILIASGFQMTAVRKNGTGDRRWTNNYANKRTIRSVGEKKRRRSNDSLISTFHRLTLISLRRMEFQRQILWRHAVLQERRLPRFVAPKYARKSSHRFFSIAQTSEQFLPRRVNYPFLLYPRGVV